MRTLIEEVKLWERFISDPHIRDKKYTVEDDAILNAILYRLEEKASLYRRDNPNRFRYGRAYPIGAVSVWLNAKDDYRENS